MTFPIARQPNIGDGLDDQTSIYLNLFNLILEISHTHEELHHSWEAIARYVKIREQWEAQQRKAQNKTP
jgi:hypothetical protein